jgi:hypothetical protein
LKSNLQLDVAITNSRVWIGGIRIGGTDVVQVLEMPLTRLQYIGQQSKNTIFSGAISEVTLKWGGFFDIAILKSAASVGEYFYTVLKRRVNVVNPACVCAP